MLVKSAKPVQTIKGITSLMSINTGLDSKYTLL